MKNHVIQFGQLEELVAELKPEQVVRVVILDISKGISAQIPDLRQVSVGVHIRTLSIAGHILACYLPVAVLHLLSGRHEGDPTWQKYDAAWAKAEALKERAIAYLQKTADEKGFTVCAAGVIDMGETRPLRATWKEDSAVAEAQRQH